MPLFKKFNSSSKKKRKRRALMLLPAAIISPPVLPVAAVEAVQAAQHAFFPGPVCSQKSAPSPVDGTITRMPSHALLSAYAHNDYEHEHPLRDALDRGFNAVEADIWLEGGQLVVAHDHSEIYSARTLESLYLAPLAKIVHENKGRVYTGTPGSLLLLIEIKDDDSNGAYKALKPLLDKYRDILTSFTDTSMNEKAVTIVFTGHKPDEGVIRKDTVRYAANAGYVGQLDDKNAEPFTPVISDNWQNHFRWRGQGPMPEYERKKLEKIVSEAHARGQKVRFWCTPDSDGAARSAVWNELTRAGVDYISTDNLQDLRGWLLSSTGEKAAAIAKKADRTAVSKGVPIKVVRTPANIKNF